MLEQSEVEMPGDEQNRRGLREEELWEMKEEVKGAEPAGHHDDEG